MKRALAASVALTLAFVGLTSYADEAAPSSYDDKVVFDHGHIDAFTVSVKDGALDLKLTEDVTAHRVVRNPEDVLMHVKEDALRDIPTGYPGSPSAYYLPISQDHNLVWPGWETTPVRDAGIERVDIQVLDVQGPGEVHVFSQNNFGGLASVLSDGGTKLPETIIAPFPAHTHANWIFTKPGAYTFKVQAKAELNGKTVSSPTRTYHWHVGDLPQPDPDPTDDPTDDPTEDPTGDPTDDPTDQPTDDPTDKPSDPGDDPTSNDPSEDPTQDPTPTPAPTNPGGEGDQGEGDKGEGAKPAPKPDPMQECRPVEVPVEGEAGKPAPKPAPKKVGVVTSGHLDLGAQIKDGKLVPSMKDDRPSPSVWVEPGSLVMSLQKKLQAPAGLEFIAKPGADIWMVPATQDPAIPWLGQNSMHESMISQTTGPLTWTLDGVDGPGQVAVFSSGTFGGGVGQRMMDTVGGPRTTTIPANTHAHPNWVFTAPGHYKVKLTMTATLKSGQKVSGSTTIHFAVGVDANKVAASLGAVAANPTKPGTKIVGRTPSGEECTLPGLPRTGVSDGGR